MAKESCQASLPNNVTVPPDFFNKPNIIRIVVDLPAPFGPINPTTSPG